MSGPWHGWGAAEELAAQHLEWSQALVRLFFVANFKGTAPAPLSVPRPGAKAAAPQRPTLADYRQALLGRG